MRGAIERGLLAALIGIPAATVSAQGSGDAASNATHQGNALAAALLNEDYATVAASACSPVLARVGGALALARQIEVGFKVMQQQGRQLLDMRFGAVSAMFDAAATRFCAVAVSQHRARQGRAAVAGFVLPRRAGQGRRRMVFHRHSGADGRESARHVSRRPEQLKLPELKQPTFERDGGG